MYLADPERYNYLDIKTHGGSWELPIAGKGPDEHNPELAYVAHPAYVEDLTQRGFGFEDSTHPDGIPQRAVRLIEGQTWLVVGPKVEILR